MKYKIWHLKNLSVLNVGIAGRCDDGEPSFSKKFSLGKLNFALEWKPFNWPEHNLCEINLFILNNLLMETKQKTQKIKKRRN